MNPEIKIRNAKETDFPIIQNFVTKEEGWNLGSTQIWIFYLNMDPQGWLIGEIEPNGIIGNIICININEQQTMIGVYLVSKNFRKLGYGSKLWDAMLRHTQSRVLSLYSLETAVAMYKKLGFTDPTFTVNVYSSQVKKADKQHSIADSETTFANGNRDIIIVNVRNNFHLLPYIIEYDCVVHTGPRKDFLEEVINDTKNLAFLAAIDKTWFSNLCNNDKTNLHNGYNSDNNHENMVNGGNEVGNKCFPIRGYGCLLKRYQGYSIGPLYADNPEIANTIFDELLTFIVETTRLDMICPFEITKIDMNQSDNLVNEVKVQKIIKSYNTRYQKWAERNVWNNPRLKDPKNLATLYRMYKTDSLNKDSSINYINNSSDKKLSALPDNFENYKDLELCAEHESTSENSTNYVNRWGIGQIPLEKVYCVSSIEAFWI